jgi:hypothetical protein
VFIVGASGTTAVASLGMTTPAGGRFVSFGENAALAADDGLAFIAADEGGMLAKQRKSSLFSGCKVSLV